MALTSTQQSSRLFKKSLGAGETLVAKEYFSEPKLGRENLFLSQIWAQSDLIPITAPVLTNGQTSGVVKYIDKLTLSVVPGSTNLAYYHADLIDAIPFNFDPNPNGSSYSYKLYKNDGVTTIDFGANGGDWLVDTSAGLLTWYGTLPTNVSDVLPPKISFYKYVGTKGFSVLSTAISTETSIRISTDNSLSSSIVSGVSGGISTETSIRLSVDESLSTALSTSLSQRISTDVSLSSEISIVETIAKGAQQAVVFDNYSILISNINGYDYNDELYGNIGQSFYILTVDVPDIWISDKNVVSQPYTYTTDQQFIDDINTGGGKLQVGYYELSLLETQKVDLTNYITSETLSTGLSQRVSTDVSLSTALSTGLSQRVSTDVSLSQGISTDAYNLSVGLSQRVSTDVSLSTGLSTGDYSLSTALSTGLSQRVSTDVSLSAAISTQHDTIINMDGDGISYDGKFNVNVDNYTIKVIDDELRTPETWMEFDSTTTILSGNTGGTNIILDYDPVGYISAYINGIEYLVSPTTTSVTGCPFYFITSIPIKTSRLYFDTVEAGFGLESGVDLIMIKYHYINDVVV